MLNPNNDRLDYGQILSAPDKYKLDFAIGTTYSLDLDALVGASLALGLSEDTDSKLATLCWMFNSHIYTESRTTDLRYHIVTLRL